MRNRTDLAPGVVVKYAKRAGMALVVCLLSAPNVSFVAAQAPTETPPGFKLQTRAFKQHGDIPAKFTCDGEDVSPALTWTIPPPG